MSGYEILDLKRRRNAINQYDGMDSDRDRLNDGMEVQASLHDYENRPLHKPIKRFGPSTPGTAQVHSGGIQWDWDDSIISLKVKPRKSPGKPYHMPTPKTMKLSVNMGNGGHDQSKYKMNASVAPHLHTLDDSKIPKLGHLDFGKTAKKRKVRI